MSSYLLAPDQGALELLHALRWDPILRRLAPAASIGHQQAQGSAGADAAGPPPACVLDAQGQAWATQLALLALQALVLLPPGALPGWLLALLAPMAREGAAADLMITGEGEQDALHYHPGTCFNICI